MEGNRRRKTKQGFLFASAFTFAFLAVPMMLRPTTCVMVHAESPSETFITNVAAPNGDGIYTGEMFELQCEDDSPSKWGAYLDSFWTMQLRSLGDYRISKIILNCSHDEYALPHIRTSSGVAKVISDTQIEINNVASSNVMLDTDDDSQTIDVQSMQVFKEVLHNITFETNGGVFEGELMTTFPEGCLIELPTDISKNGYYFCGWYDNKNLSGDPYTNIPENVETDVTYWAKWFDHIEVDTAKSQFVYENKYVTVNVTSEGDSDGSYLTANNTMTITAKNNRNICKIIYTIGYYGDNHSTFNANVGERTSNSSAITLTNFAANSVVANTTSGVLQIKKLDIWLTEPVTLHTNGGTITEGNISEYDPTTGTTLPTKITLENYVFLGWYDNENFEGSSVTQIAANESGLKEFWAKWIEKTVYDTNNAINAVASLEQITLDDEDVIVAARAAYDALTPEQKAKISEDVVAILIAAEKEINDIKAVNAMTDLVGALPDIGDLTLADKEAVINAKTAYESLTDDQKNRINPDVVKKLEDACARIAELESSEGTINDINALPSLEEISIDDKEDVEAAKAKYDALPPEEKEKIPAEVLEKLLEAVDKINTIVAEDMTKDINALPDVDDITLEDKDEIEAVLAEYDSLTDEQKEKLSPETIEKLESVKKELNDIVAAKETTDVIVSLPEVNNISLEDKDSIEAARAAYEALTPEQKAKVSQETLDKLTSAEKEINDLVVAKNATDAVDALPAVNTLTLNDKEAVEDAIAKYEALTSEQKAKVSQETVDKLNAAKEKINSLVAQDTTTDIEELPNPTNVSLEDRDEIEAVLAKYESLTDEQKEKLSPETVEKLEEVKDALDTVIAEDATNDINDLPNVEDITLEDKDEILAAVEKYESLTDEQKAKVDPETVEKLEEAQKEIADIVVAHETTDAIDSLPEASNVTLEDKDEIESIIEAYQSLTENQKEKLSPETVEKLEEVKDALDTVIAEDATNDINDLPNVENISLDNEDEIEAIIAKYESLTDEQKEKLSEEVVEKYTEAVQEYETLKTTNDTIIELPSANEITKDDFDAIEEAREAYEALTPEQKEKIPEETLQKLEEAEHAVDVIVVDGVKTVVDQIGEITLSDNSKEAIEAARAAYEALSDEQKALFPQESLKAIENAESVYNVLEKINGIGDVRNNNESKEAIEAARAAYDALTDEQKAMVNEDALTMLLNSEKTYQSKHNAATAVIVSIIVVSSLSVVGVAVLLGVGLPIILKKSKKTNKNS